MEWIIVLWPLGVGAVIALALRDGHAWLAGGGAALVFGGTFLASFGASGDDWLISERELLRAAAFWWSALWLCGVGVGTLIVRARHPRDGDYPS